MVVRIPQLQSGISEVIEQPNYVCFSALLHPLGSNHLNNHIHHCRQPLDWAVPEDSQIRSNRLAICLCDLGKTPVNCKVLACLIFSVSLMPL